MAGVTLEQILDLVQSSLDEPELPAADLAGRAYLSRFHFDRIVRATLGEPPGAFRRRLLLERAAHRLVSTDEPVIEIALDAGYGSPDAFTRAFTAAYGGPPSAYRRRPAVSHDLAAPNRIHFHPPGGLRLPAESRSDTMTVLTRMYDHHIALTGQIIDRVDRLPLDVAERRIELSVEGIDADMTLASVTARLVTQLEMWADAIAGSKTIVDGEGSLGERLTAANTRFQHAVVEPVAAGRGDETFVDATCNPPQTFSLGGVLAHVLTFSAVRRTLAVGALESAGVGDLGAGDPMRYVGGSGDDASVIERNADVSAIRR